MWQPGREVSFGENGYVYVYGWVPLLFTWNYHNIVNRLHPNVEESKEEVKSLLMKVKEGSEGAGLKLNI